MEHVAAREKYPGPAHEQVTEGESCSNRMERDFMRSPLRQKIGEAISVPLDLIRGDLTIPDI